MNPGQEKRAAPKYQVCPVCWGHGIVPRGFFRYPAGQSFTDNSAAPDRCERCRGTGTILPPPTQEDG